MRLSNGLFTTQAKMKVAIIGLGALLFAGTAPAQYSATPTQFDVTDAGAARYTIPLYSAPSKGNLDVKLALQYSSQAGNGAFGLGWNLTGVSSITRCPKTIAEDGVRGGVKNDSSDIFCLDGQKLRATEGAYGASGTKYRTAIESYSLIESFGNLAGGPQYFTVRTKSGLVMQFGLDDGVNKSRLDHPIKGVGRVWMVNQIADRFNNAINFGYYKNPAMGEQLLTTVTHANGQTEIQYQPRPANDQIIKYDDGAQLGSTGLIANKIVIRDAPVSGGVQSLRVFKEYRLNYTQSATTRRSLLTSVQECASSGACLPTVVMNYQSQGTPGFTRGPEVAGLYPQAPVLVVDTKGKGIQEVVEARYSKLFPLSPGTGAAWEADSRELRSGPLTVWDIDGDSKTDYQIVFKDPPYTTQYTKYGSNSVAVVTQTPANVGLGPACYADINGDGVSEPIGVSLAGGDEYGPYSIAVNEGLTGTAVTIYTFPLFTKADQANRVFANYSYCRGIDIDGDGRAEVVVGNGAAIVTYNGTSLQLTSAVIPTTISTIDYGDGGSVTSGGLPGDFNGDGKTDAYVTTSRTTPQVLYSNGSLGPLVNGWTEPTADLNASKVYCAADFNGDGRTDLLVLLKNAFTLFLSNGNSFTLVSLPGLYPPTQCADFNGDGIADLYVGVENRYWYNTLPGAVDALSSMHNGAGLIHRVQYKSITDDSVYTKYSDVVKPVVDLQTPIQVVWRATEQTGASLEQTTQYSYAGLRADLHRRGTLGFYNVTSYNEVTHITTSTRYRQDYPFIGLKELSSEHIRSGSGFLTKTLEIKYKYYARGLAGMDSAPNAQYAQVHLASVETRRYDLNASFVGWTKEYFVQTDAYGNVMSSVVEQLDSYGTGTTSGKSTTNTYINDTASWLLGQLISSTTTSLNFRDLPTTAVGGATNASSQTGNGSIPTTSPTPAEQQAARVKAAMAPILSLLLED
jgi:Salmonella virulence plasmid 65kDa B protein/FG-GAP-like repeat